MLKPAFLFAYSLALLLCLSSPVFSQSAVEPSKFKQFNITVNYEDYTVKTQMLSQNKNIHVNNDRQYLWYSSQQIIETKGGYDGKLLHGTYRSFYLNNQLKEQGQIRYGLRHKEWKYWYSDGKLREVITWKNGVKNGSYSLYNDYGELMAKGNFKNDKLHGRFYTYGPNKKITEKKRYKHGDEVIPKVKAKRQKKEKKPWLTFKKKKAKEPSVEQAAPAEKKTPFLKRLFKKKKTTAEGAGQKEKKTERKRSEKKKTEKKKTEKKKSITT